MQPPTRDEVLTQLETLCACKGLALKLSLQRLLRHVVLTALDGKTSDLKEPLIGIHVYGKFADWNPKEDATVRVAMTKLRKEVNAHYDSEGKADAVLICLEPGGYAPEFLNRKALVEKATSPEPVEQTKPEAASDLAPREQVASTPPAALPAASQPPPAAPPPPVIIIREVIRERVSYAPAPDPRPTPTPTETKLPTGFAEIALAAPIALAKWLRNKTDE